MSSIKSVLNYLHYEALGNILVFKTIETFYLVRYTGSHCQQLDWLQGYCIIVFIQKLSTHNVINKVRVIEQKSG